MNDRRDIKAIAVEHGWTIKKGGKHLFFYDRPVTVAEDDLVVVKLRAVGRSPSEMLAVLYDHWDAIEKVFYGGFWTMNPQTGEHGLLEMTLNLREAVVVHLTDTPDMEARFADIPDD